MRRVSCRMWVYATRPAEWVQRLSATMWFWPRQHTRMWVFFLFHTYVATHDRKSILEHFSWELSMAYTTCNCAGGPYENHMKLKIYVSEKRSGRLPSSHERRSCSDKHKSTPSAHPQALWPTAHWVRLVVNLVERRLSMKVGRRRVSQYNGRSWKRERTCCWSDAISIETDNRVSKPVSKFASWGKTLSLCF